MDYDAISAAVREAGMSWSDAAQAAGRSKSTLIRVAQRHVRSRPTAVALAAVLDRPVEEVFPDVPQYHPAVEEARKERIEAARRRVEAARKERAA